MKIRRSLLAALIITFSLHVLAADKTRDRKSAVRFSNPPTMAKPVSNYSQVVEVMGGKLLFIAGQVAIDPSGKLVGDDFREQVEQIFKNLKLAVEAAGGQMSDLVKLNYFVAESVDPSQYGAVREVRDRYINTAAAPASTFVIVKRLVRPEYLIEVEAEAAVK